MSFNTMFYSVLKVGSGESLQIGISVNLTDIQTLFREFIKGLGGGGLPAKININF
jgi:hypothetical protein